MSTLCKRLFVANLFISCPEPRRSLFAFPTAFSRLPKLSRLSTQALGSSAMPNHAQGSQVLAEHLEKPLLDDRNYRVIRLPNQLEALLIHDKTTDKASAAVDVNAGSLSDEDDLPGMAHAVEHMLFLGNEKFPQENDYTQYLAAHSGSHNAFTAQTSTNYFFEMGVDTQDSHTSNQANGTQVNGILESGTQLNGVHGNAATSNVTSAKGTPKGSHVPFYGALDRFSQFFVSPLFLEGSLDRELRAVDSENKKNLQSDVWRLQQLRRSLSNPQHPNCKFSTGNLQTLRDEPLARGVKIRNEFMRFYKEQYSANRMKLAVLGREPLDELQGWVEELFGAVPNKNLPKLRWDIPVFTERELLTEICAKPVMDSRSLEVSFPYPDEENLWESLPGRYISHLIGHEGPGSIFAYIKARGWANSLSAGARTICPGTGLFDITVGLTPEGLKHYREVVQVMFQYIAILHETAPKEWIFEELKRMSEVDFKFKEKSPASSTASMLAGDMQSPIPRELLVAGKRVVRKFNPEAIRQGIESLNPQNFRLLVVSKDPLQGEIQREKWYGTEYTMRKIPEDFLGLINRAFTSSAAERPAEIFLPGKNEFIPSGLEVEQKPTDAPLKAPKLVRNDGNVRLWYKKDDQFWVPKANFYLRLRNPICASTPRNYISGHLFTCLVDDILTEYAYDAELAGVEYDLDCSNHGITITIGGYNDKMPVLLEKVLSSMREIRIQDDRFEIIKEKVSRGLRNKGFVAPYRQIGEYSRWLVSERTWIGEQLLAELEDLTANDLRALQPLLLGQMHMEALAHGNLHQEDALKLVDLADRILKPKTLPPAQWPIARSLLLPAGSNFVYSRDLVDPANINHAIEYVLQIGEVKDHRRRAKLLLLDQMTTEPAFDTLRTKEQLGYVVFSGAIRNATVASYRVLIQSERSPEYLETRIESFLRAFKHELVNMSDESFEAHRRSKINERLERLKNLGQESMRFWLHISDGVFHFEEKENDVVNLKSLTKDDMIAFFNEYIDPASSSRAKTSVFMRAKGAVDDAASREDHKLEFLELVQTHFASRGQEPSLDVLRQRYENVDFSAGDWKHLATVLTAYLDVCKGNGTPEAKRAAEKILAPLGISAAETNGTSADHGEPKIQIPSKAAVFIEDVHAFKASMPLTAGPRPIKPLNEFEDLEAKL